MIYISTDYVFDGKRGTYKESDIPNPVNYYSYTKLWGEEAVKNHKNYLIIRTTFAPNGPWKHAKAFIDQYSGKEFVKDIAPEIASAIEMEDLFGLVHIAGERKSVYELAKRVSPDIQPMYRNEVSVPLPYDVSLDCKKWENIKRTYRC